MTGKSGAGWVHKRDYKQLPVRTPVRSKYNVWGNRHASESSATIHVKPGVFQIRMSCAIWSQANSNSESDNEILSNDHENQHMPDTYDRRCLMAGTAHLNARPGQLGNHGCCLA